MSILRLTTSTTTTTHIIYQREYILYLYPVIDLYLSHIHTHVCVMYIHAYICTLHECRKRMIVDRDPEQVCDIHPHTMRGK